MTFRWASAVKQQVYHVRGANALWHHDGNEKLQPWGFFVHGCIDGYSRRICYLECTPDKEAATVRRFFLQAVDKLGWPSRVRGDHGTENNAVEQEMIQKRGINHQPYL